MRLLKACVFCCKLAASGVMVCMLCTHMPTLRRCNNSLCVLVIVAGRCWWWMPA